MKYPNDINEYVVDTSIIEKFKKALEEENYELCSKLKQQYNEINESDNNELFYDIWLDSRVTGYCDYECELEDPFFVLFKIWEKKNWKWLVEKHFENDWSLFEVEPEDIICFTSMCSTCGSQRMYPISRCYNCSKFRGDFEEKSNLFIYDADWMNEFDDFDEEEDD